MHKQNQSIILIAMQWITECWIWDHISTYFHTVRVQILTAWDVLCGLLPVEGRHRGAPVSGVGLRALMWPRCPLKAPASGRKLSGRQRGGESCLCTGTQHGSSKDSPNSPSKSCTYSCTNTTLTTLTNIITLY